MADIVRADPRLDFGAIVRCDGCGLRTVETAPSDEALGTFYQAYYANIEYGAKRAKKISRCRRRIRAMKPSIRGRRFVDVGCNLGFAVEAARLEGFDAHGIEIDAAAVAAAQDLFPDTVISCESVESLAASGDQFDFVWCTEVLEHARDFRSFANALGRLAAPGAVLFLTTPDAGHWRAPRPFAAWDEVKPPEHLQWFDAGHLRTLFEPQGFSLHFGMALKPGLRLMARKHDG